MNTDAAFINSVWEASLDGMFVGEAIRDPQGTIVDLLIIKVNPAFTRIERIKESDAVSKRYLDLFPRAHSASMFDVYCRVIETGMPAHDVFHYKGEETDAWYETAATPLGRDRLLVTFHDLTSVKRLQLQLEQKVWQLESLNRNLENFVFASSHDLKEPLRKTLFFLDRFKNSYVTRLDAKGINYLGRVEASVERMRKVVDEFHVYADINATPNENQAVDLNKVVREVVHDLELHLLEKKASLQIDPLPRVRGSSRQLHRLFQNLMENALTFSLKDKPVKIKLSSRKIRGKEALVSVPVEQWNKPFHEITLEDNGIGFDPKYADRIFDVFQRLHSNYSGTGLGLFIAQKVVQNHKGWIYASSKEGVGTKVTIVMPCD